MLEKAISKKSTGRLTLRYDYDNGREKERKESGGRRRRGTYLLVGGNYDVWWGSNSTH